MIDAEGNFQVVVDRGYVRVMFRINLHIDDAEVLHAIQKRIKVGTVTIGKSSATYTIRKALDLENALIPLLERQNLKTTKYLDYLDFRAVLIELLQAKSSAFTREKIKWVQNCIKNINLGRTEVDISLIPDSSINKFWLLGFIEGEGTFGYKNLVPYLPFF